MSDDEAEESPASGSNARVDAARRDVERAHARFNTDLERVSEAGRDLTTSIVRSARPALIGVAIVTGVALVVAVWRRRATRPLLAQRQRNPSPAAELARAAVMALASVAGRHLAAKLVSMGQTALESSSPLPATAHRRTSASRPPANSNGSYA